MIAFKSGRIFYQNILRNLLGVLFIITLLNRQVYAQREFLNNPSFEQGATAWNGIADIQVPNGWSLIWAENNDWSTPSTRVWARSSNAKSLWRDGNYNFGAFTRGHPFWIQLNQTVSGLDPSRVYNLSVPIFPEMIAAYVEGNGKLYNSQERAIEVRLYIRSAGQDAYDTGYLNAISLPVGRWTRLSLNFAPISSEAEISIEIRNAAPGQFNAAYLDGLSLQPTNLYSPAYQQKIQAQAASEKEAKTLLKQMESQLQEARFTDPMTYTVASGDSWAKIASRFGTTAPELARLNGSRDSTSLRVGQILAVPSDANNSELVAAATERVAQARAYLEAIQKGESPAKPVFAELPVVSPVDIGSTATAVAVAQQQRQALAAAEQEARALLTQTEREFQQTRYNNPVAYIIAPGDNLSRIATRYNSTSADLARLNNMRENASLRVGQVIKVPSDVDNSVVVATAAARVTQAQAYLAAVQSGQLLPKPELPALLPNVPYVPPAVATATSPAPLPNPTTAVPAAADTTLLSTPTVAPAIAPADSTPTAAPTGSAVYVVQPGDNLARIARKLGVSPDEILRLNNIINPSLIQPGQQLIVP
jgi:LysM repeat protein